MSGLSEGLAAAHVRLLAGQLEAGFRTSLISFWYPRAIDPDGGYRIDWDARGRPAPRDERGAMSQARLMYVFARAARAGHRREVMLEAAEHGFAYLRDVMWDDAHGGFVWTLDDPRKFTFAQAFGLFALSELVRAGGTPDAAELATRTVDVLDAHAHDPSNGGYQEFFAADWSAPSYGQKSVIDLRPPADKLVNTHMHMMEAMTAAHRAGIDPRASERAAELVDVFTRRALRGPVHAPITDTWSPAWKPRWRDHFVRFGHLFELGWLLLDTCAAIGVDDRDALGVSHRMIRYVEAHGVDPDTSGVWRGGRLGGPADDRRYEWWAQAEALIAYVTLYARTGEVRHLDRASATWRFIYAHMVDHTVGEWHERLSPDRVGEGPKGSLWKAGYHSTRALLDSAAALRALSTGADEAAG